MGKTRESGDLVSDNLFSTDISNDRVGIGSTQPTTKLDVNGTVTATSFSGDGSTLSGIVTSITAGNNISISGATGNVTITGLANTANINSDTIDTGSLNVTGITTLAGNTNINGDSIFAGGIDVDGHTELDDVNVSGAITATTFTGALDGNAGTATSLENARNFSVTGDFVTASAVSFDGTSAVALAATITTDSIILGTYTSGDYVESVSGTANQIQVTSGTGEGSTPTIGFVANPTIGGNATIGQDLTVTRDLQVTRNLNVDGTVTIGGTSATISAETLKISDPDIVLGFRSDANGNDISNDSTASHGGVALASTEGSPLVNLVGAGETLSPTYKKIMWFKTNSFTGLNTDAWLSNYAFGVGTTSMSSGTKFAVGNIEANFDDFTAVRNINSSGIITATNLNITGITTLGGDVKIDGDITSRFLTIVSTDSGSSAEPIITLRRDSSSPAADDQIGQLRFTGENSSGQVREYASITGKIVSPTLFAEKGSIETRINGFLVSTQTSTLLNLQSTVNVSGALTATSLAINDFDITRKSGNTEILNTSGDLLLYGSGGSNTIKIQPDEGNNSITANSGGSVELFFNNVKKLETVTSGVDITGSLDISGQASVTGSVNIADKIIHIGDTDTSIRFPSNDTFTVETGGTERFRIASDGVATFNSGEVVFGGTAVSATEGGQIRLTSPSGQSNGDTIIDMNSANLRFFYASSPNKGAYLTLSSLANGVGSRILTTSDEGSGNGLDADTLDGQQGSYYLDYDNFTDTPIESNLQGSYKDYQALIDFGSAVAGTEVRIISASLANSSYSTIGFQIDVVDNNGNHAPSNTTSTVEKSTYYVNCSRTDGTTLNSPDKVTIKGPTGGDLIRARKVSTGNYEVTLKNTNQWREYRINVKIIGVNGNHTITYRNGDTPSTAVTSYTSSSSSTNIDFFQSVEADSYLGGPFVGNSTLATFDPPGGGTGTDTATNVAFAFERGDRIVGYVDGYIRSMLEWSTGSEIIIGQSGTALITGINLKPGNSGDAKVNGNRILTTADSTDSQRKAIIAAKIFGRH